MKSINKINKKKYYIIFLTVVGIVSLGGTIAYKKSYDSFLQNAKNQTIKEQNIILSSFIGKNEKKLIYCLETWGYQLYSIGDNSKVFKNNKDQYLSYNISEIGEVISIYDIYGQAVNLNVPKE